MAKRNMGEQEPRGPHEYGVLPKSGGSSVEKDGIDNQGYLTKKGTPSGDSAKFNYLPPGMNIEDQMNADIRSEPIEHYTGGLSYPGDGGFPGKARNG
jgi:hypothetical protein